MVGSDGPRGEWTDRSIAPSSDGSMTLLCVCVCVCATVGCEGRKLLPLCLRLLPVPSALLPGLQPAVSDPAGRRRHHQVQTLYEGAARWW